MHVNEEFLNSIHSGPVSSSMANAYLMNFLNHIAMSTRRSARLWNSPSRLRHGSGWAVYVCWHETSAREAAFKLHPLTGLSSEDKWNEIRAQLGCPVVVVRGRPCRINHYFASLCHPRFIGWWKQWQLRVLGITVYVLCNLETSMYKIAWTLSVLYKLIS